MIESSLCDSISESRIGIKCFNYFRVSSFDDFLKEVIQVESSVWGGCFGASAAWDLRCPPRLPPPTPYRRWPAAYVDTTPPKVCPISPLSWRACPSILNRPTLLLLQLWLAQKQQTNKIFHPNTNTCLIPAWNFDQYGRQCRHDGQPFYLWQRPLLSASAAGTSEQDLWIYSL